MGRRSLITVACALSAAIACSAETGSESEPAAQTLIGRVDGTDVRLALVREGEAFAAHVWGRGDTLAVQHDGCRAGIIVWQALAGPACEAQGSWCDAAGRRGQITPVACSADEPRHAGQVPGSRLGDPMVIELGAAHSRASTRSEMS